MGGTPSARQSRSLPQAVFNVISHGLHSLVLVWAERQARLCYHELKLLVGDAAIQGLLSVRNQHLQIQAVVSVLLVRDDDLALEPIGQGEAALRHQHRAISEFLLHNTIAFVRIQQK